MQQIAELAQLLMASNYTIAFSGAGISTESGIPDFRSRGEGLWTKQWAPGVGGIKPNGSYPGSSHPEY